MPPAACWGTLGYICCRLSVRRIGAGTSPMSSGREFWVICCRWMSLFIMYLFFPIHGITVSSCSRTQLSSDPPYVWRAMLHDCHCYDCSNSALVNWFTLKLCPWNDCLSQGPPPFPFLSVSSHHGAKLLTRGTFEGDSTGL